VIRVDDHDFSAIKNVLAESSTFASSVCSFGSSDLGASLATGALREGFVFKIHKVIKRQKGIKRSNFQSLFSQFLFFLCPFFLEFLSSRRVATQVNSEWEARADGSSYFLVLL
jgi:hypothetical protein